MVDESWGWSFSLRKWSMLDEPGPSGCPHIQEHKFDLGDQNNNNNNNKNNQENMKLMGKVGSGSRVTGGGVKEKCDQNTLYLCMEFLDN